MYHINSNKEAKISGALLQLHGEKAILAIFIVSIIWVNIIGTNDLTIYIYTKAMIHKSVYIEMKN